MLQSNRKPGESVTLLSDFDVAAAAIAIGSEQEQSLDESPESRISAPILQLPPDLVFGDQRRR